MQAPTLPTLTMPTLSSQHQTTSDVERSWAVGDGRVAPAHCRPIDAFHPRLVLAPRHSTASTLRYVTTPASLSLSVHVCVFTTNKPNTFYVDNLALRSLPPTPTLEEIKRT